MGDGSMLLGACSVSAHVIAAMLDPRRTPAFCPIWVAIVLQTACFNFDLPAACAAEPRRCSASDATIDDGAPVPDSPSEVAPDAAEVGGVEALELAEETCSRLTACNQGVGASSFVECIRDLVNIVADRSEPRLGAPLWSCLHLAKSCSEISGCTGGATSAAACSASGSGTSQTCVAGSRVTCSGNKNVGAELCQLAGRNCLTMSATTAACTAGSICPTTSPACSGDQLVVCEGNLDKGNDCKALGGACGSSGGSSGCAGGRTACSTATAACSEDIAEFCRFGRSVRFDCAAMGRRCEAGVGRGCVPLSAECSEADAPSCDGTRIRYCLAGKWRTVDCSTFALGGCRSVFVSGGGSSVACGAP